MRMKGKVSRKKKSRKDRSCLLKTNMRMYSAEDVIWMLQCDEHRERKAVETDVGLPGVSVKIENGFSNEGFMTYASQYWDWESVAIDLGFDKAEPVLDQHGNWSVLLYDVEKVDA